MGLVLPRHWNGILFFKELDNTRITNIQGVLTLGWRIKDVPDEWSHRFMAVKEKNGAAVAGATRLIPKVLTLGDWSAVAISAAIPSSESHLPADSPLASIGEELSCEHRASWLPHLLSKKPHQSLHSIPDYSQRDSEVRGKYQSSKLPDTYKTVLILDDFATRGSTLSDAGRAIKATNPGVRVFGFCLGKNESQRWATRHDFTLTNNHISEERLRIWNGQE